MAQARWRGWPGHPDGERFAAILDPSDARQADLLVIGNIDGRTPTLVPLTSGQVGFPAPAWSVDGTRLYYFDIDAVTVACDPADVDVLLAGSSAVISDEVLSSFDAAPAC